MLIQFSPIMPSVSVVPVILGFDLLLLMASETHKSCSASVSIHIKAFISVTTWHGTDTCRGSELWHVSWFEFLHPCFESFVGSVLFCILINRLIGQHLHLFYVIQLPMFFCTLMLIEDTGGKIFILCAKKKKFIWFPLNI